MDGKLEHMTNWLVAIRSTLETRAKHEDLEYTLADVENKIYAVQAEANGIINSPKPEPKKPEEEKKEEPAASDGGAAGAGGADATMPPAGEGETPAAEG